MKNGARATKVDHRDYSFTRTFGAIVPQFPEEYFTDAGGMPDQNADGQPFGCTNYTQAELPNDIERALNHKPPELEIITHANALGGIDIRVSLDAARKKLGWIQAYYNVHANAPLDYFDAIRYAMLSGYAEKRSVSWGTPWFSEWENAAVGTVDIQNPDGTWTHTVNPNGKTAIMPMPGKLTPHTPWHNSAFVGWKTINGVPYLINKSWQGTNPGDGGYLYFSREVVNATMKIPGTVAYTATQNKPQDVKTVPVNIIEWFNSWRNIIMSWFY